MRFAHYECSRRGLPQPPRRPPRFHRCPAGQALASLPNLPAQTYRPPAGPHRLIPFFVQGVKTPVLTGNKPRFFSLSPNSQKNTFFLNSTKNGSGPQQRHLAQLLDFSIFQTSKISKTKLNFKTLVFHPGLLPV